MVFGNKVSKPEWVCNGCAVWEKTSRNGEKYLTIKMVGHDYVNVFKNDKKDKQVDKQTKAEQPKQEVTSEASQQEVDSILNDVSNV